MFNFEKITTVNNNNNNITTEESERVKNHPCLYPISRKKRMIFYGNKIHNNNNINMDCLEQKYIQLQEDYSDFRKESGPDSKLFVKSSHSLLVPNVQTFGHVLDCDGATSGKICIAQRRGIMIIDA